MRLQGTGFSIQSGIDRHAFGHVRDFRGRTAFGNIRAYLKTVNTPKQRVFLPAVHHFSLQYTKYSREKMAPSREKSLAVGHISGFQIDPNKKAAESICIPFWHPQYGNRKNIDTFRLPGGQDGKRHPWFRHSGKISRMEPYLPSQRSRSDGTGAAVPGPSPPIVHISSTCGAMLMNLTGITTGRSWKLWPTFCPQIAMIFGLLQMVRFWTMFLPTVDWNIL